LQKTLKKKNKVPKEQEQEFVEKNCNNSATSVIYTDVALTLNHFAVG
jgi:hypothetical protein